MAELQETGKVDVQSNYTVGNNSDPKNMQELTQYVSANYLFKEEEWKMLLDPSTPRSKGSIMM
ncbi:hypothetical protein RUM44_007145 [Polyplax serrata]|uniref:Uncharacterized protein n=1 Tax=Polyplax serrata TaxID=468196 RepID=A0ABR1AZX3_POLSC